MNPLVNQVRIIQSAIATKQAEMDQLQASLVEAETAMNRKKLALLKEVEWMLCGTRQRWEVRQPERVLRRLAEFVGIKEPQLYQ